MRIQEISVIQARIPLRRPVRHASFHRTENATILVRCRLADGTVGWGEGLPRPYVTGETIETAWQHLTNAPFAAYAMPVESVSDLLELADRIELPRPQGARECFGNSARCALELAILDAFCQAMGLPVSELTAAVPDAAPLAERSPSTTYSAAITGSSRRSMQRRCWLFRLAGFRQCKVKVGIAGTDDRRQLETVRRIFGRDAQLRIDANEAWTAQELPARLESLASLGLASVEQPVPHADVLQLKRMRGALPIPVMLDESLCSRQDAERAVEEGLCDAFNLRLSKCGGFLPTLRLARLAADAGVLFQLGCQVGETGVLSAAGRHFATSVRGLFAVEGSFDRFLVKERLTNEDLTFGWRGRGPALTTPGLSVSIDPVALRRVTEREERFHIG